MVDFSIITPVLNGESTLEDCLTSIASQSECQLQHIIVDGGSTDRSLSIINKYPHIHKVLEKEKISLYEALNLGITESIGEVVGILHSDDTYTSRNTLKMVGHHFKNQSIDAIYGDLVVVDRNNQSKVVRIWKAGKFNHHSLKWGWMPPHPTLFVRKSVFKKFGLYNTSLSLASDYEMIIRLFYMHKIRLSYLNYPLVVMRNGGISNNKLTNRLDANRQDLKAWRINDISICPLLRLIKPVRKITQFFPSLF